MGDYIGVTGFAADGKLIASYAFRAKYEHSFGGSPPYATLVEDVKLEEMLSKITSSLNWHGGIDLDCIETKDGQYALLEINPRLSGTVIFPLKLGLDLPSLYLSARTGKFDDRVFAPKKSDANGYINLLAEAFYIAKDPKTRRLEAREFRNTHICFDSMFWDDRPLARAMNRHLRRIAWSAWLKNIVAGVLRHRHIGSLKRSAKRSSL